MAQMIKQSDFKPAWWLPGPHLQTMFPVFLRRPVEIETRRERLHLSDGDFLDLEWAGNHGPIVTVLHGLGGSIDSHYAKGILRELVANGWRGLLMHFRGCGGEHNRLPRTYHSGDSADLAFLVETLEQRFPNTTLAVVGYSLGGSVLLKYLGETGKLNPLTAAVAVSVPFELDVASNKINKGFSKVYQWYLLRDIRLKLLEKYKGANPPVERVVIENSRSFWEFDEKVTAPLHGFKGAQDYYERTSSRQFLKSISIPTLIIHSVDDPLMTPEAIAEPEELSEHLTFELSESGGHVGFVTGANPLQPRYWLEERIPIFLSGYFQ